VAISEEQVLTNCHVLGGEKRSYVVGSGKSQSTDEVEVVAANYDADRCVLKVRGLFLQPVRGVRAVSGLEVGESVYAIGNPRGLQRTFTDGLVSGVRAVGELRLIQMTAAISPGSSGGGLFDSSGNLLGITSSSLRGAQSVNFAIPAEDFWR
jgi:S1-C subfamily serine protease